MRRWRKVSPPSGNKTRKFELYLLGRTSGTIQINTGPVIMRITTLTGPVSDLNRQKSDSKPNQPVIAKPIKFIIKPAIPL
jgi:hypothetical protein